MVVNIYMSLQGYLMQILSVKLGVATGTNMAQQCRYVLTCCMTPKLHCFTMQHTVSAHLLAPQQRYLLLIR